MAASRAEVSMKIRRIIRRKVHAGASNEEIYRYISSEYGPDKVAVPRSGWLSTLSYGFPYLALAVMTWVAFWFAWTWSERGREQRSRPIPDSDPEAEAELEELGRHWNNPLRD